MKGYGIALGGGGAKGSYEIGVWKALRELQIPIAAVAGTSVGALNGAIIVQDEYELAHELWCNIEMQKIINLSCTSILDGKPFTAKELAISIKEILENGGVDVTPLKEILRTYIDEKRIRTSPIEFGLVTFSLSSMKPQIVYKNDIPEGKMVDYLLASSCFPLFKPQEIGKDKFIDGGIYDNLPVSVLADRGYKDIIVIDVSGIGRVRKVKRNDLSIVTIKNSEFLGKTFQFDGETCKRNIKIGYLDTMRVFGEYAGKRYYISKHWREQGPMYPLNDEEQKKLNSLLELNLTAFSPDRLANYSLIRTLYKYSEGKLDSRTLVNAAAEITAEVLDVDRLDIYTWDELAAAIMKAYNEIRESSYFKDSLKDIRKLLKHRKKSGLELMDSRFIASYLSSFSEADKRMISIRKFLAVFLPKTCIASLFLSMLSKRVSKHSI
ncbi:MAG: patatin-like phospholipase family protein [Bacillota bacterium]